MALPLSGSSAAIGPYMKNGAQMAVDEINAKGGVHGRQLVLKVEDDACDPRTATAAANKLVTEGVRISVGGYCSSATLPTLAVFHRKGVPMLIPAANSNDLVNQHLDNVFMLNGTGTQQSAAAVAFMKKQGATKVSLVDDNTSYSKNITDLVAKALAGGAPALAGRQSVTAGESDYSAAVKAVMDQHPDFVYWTGYYQEGGLLIRQLRQAGYTGRIMVADGSVDAKLASIAGNDNAEGVFATMTMTPQTIPGDEQWVTGYKAKFGADPGPYSTQSYDAVRVAAEAVSNAGSTDGGKVIKALEAINGFQIFSGPLKFTAEHTLSTGGFQILVVKSGQFALQDANPA
ncbi:MAG: branched-chain amino acid ABC transporter substrate-binding protein [Catenulispora sp.]|nr:branched-chain amino acid ABC transporter substrate-binding protein [Catenulispora sp.]